VCNATRVDLAEYKWYQKRAGLAGFFDLSEITFSGGLHASLKAFSVKVEPAPGHSIVAGFLSTRIVLTGFSSARRLA